MIPGLRGCVDHCDVLVAHPGDEHEQNIRTRTGCGITAFNEMAADPKKRKKLFSTNLAVMPSTPNARRMKSLRSYYAKVQQWLGAELPRTDCGLLGKDMSLVQIPTALPFAPEKLLQAVSWGCKTG